MKDWRKDCTQGHLFTRNVLKLKLVDMDFREICKGMSWPLIIF